MSWREGIVYQVYPRSFADSDGDGVGDLEGIRQHLDHLVWLGVDALWLSPVYPSPLADWGYDVSDYETIDPRLGSLESFDRLLADAHDRGLRLLMDLVPCHTSIEHPWFRDHPDWYIWADSGERPPNNWTSTFGGPAWRRDEDSGRWYLHSFYPEQPDLDWHNPNVVRAMQDVIRFWVDRGVDGFRLDAIDRLVKDPELRDDPPSSEPFGLPLMEHELGRDLRHSRNAAGTDRALAALREAAGDALLVGEVYLPTLRAAPYLEHLDRLFVFELLHATWDADTVRRAIGAAAELRGRPGAGPAWVLSNHDFGFLAHRFGREHERAAAMLLLTLPGTAFIYQGDEIAMGNGPGSDPPHDRVGRDSFRHPMQWDASPGGGFTTGEPWLPLVDPGERSVAAQRDDPRSVLTLYRDLIALRRTLAPDFELLDDGPEDVVSYRRGDQVVSINFSAEPRRIPAGQVVLASAAGALEDDGSLAPHAGVVMTRA